MSYSVPEGFEPSKYKVLVATPNYTNTFPAEVYGSHMDCVQEWTKLGMDFRWMVIGRTFVNFARTEACTFAVDNGFTHIFWVDDDAVIVPKILPRFLMHDKDVVISPYPMRRPPHEIGILSSTTGDFEDQSTYRNWIVSDMLQGLKECDGGGTHAMLMKTSCLVDTLGPSLEDYGNLSGSESMKTENEKGYPYVVMPKVGTEDMFLCYRLKYKGVKIWCDTDVFSSHVGFAPVIGPGHVEQMEQWASNPENINEDNTRPLHNNIPVLRMREGFGHDSGRAEGVVPGVRSEQVDARGTTALV